MNNILATAKLRIAKESIKIVSFDIFDTLVLRPTIHNDDILRLYFKQLKSEYNIDIESDRLSAQEELQNPFASLKEIWYHIAKKRAFSVEFAKLLASKEYKFDTQFLSMRRSGKTLYDYAISCGKKVIIVSDMYYSSDQLNNILTKCGYTDVANIYVSCECHAVKRNGMIFKNVLEHENIDCPSDILHIGDSKKADFFGAQQAGLQSVHIPSNISQFLKTYGGKKMRSLFGTTVYESLIYGTAINTLYENDAHEENMFSLKTFACLIIFPMLLHVALLLHSNPDIQDKQIYHVINFVSRDGYLTKKAYDTLSLHFSDSLPSCYLSTSRISCSILTENSFFDRMYANYIPATCTLSEFIGTFFMSEKLRQKLMLLLNQQDLSIPVKLNDQKCKNLLIDFVNELEIIHKAQKQATMEYYSKMINGSKRVIIVDCGFSGTISEYLTEGFMRECYFDKFFFWDNSKNRLRDQQIGTRTYTAFVKGQGHCLAPMVESMFSEISGSCIGFTKNSKGEIIALLDEEWYPSDMKNDIRSIQNHALSLIEKFSCSFGDFFPLIEISSMQSIMNIISFFESEEYPQFFDIFDNIRFKETCSVCMEKQSLGTMMRNKNKNAVNKYQEL